MTAGFLNFGMQAFAFSNHLKQMLDVHTIALPHMLFSSF